MNIFEAVKEFEKGNGIRLDGKTMYLNSDDQTIDLFDVDGMLLNTFYSKTDIFGYEDVLREDYELVVIEEKVSFEEKRLKEIKENLFDEFDVLICNQVFSFDISFYEMTLSDGFEDGIVFNVGYDIYNLEDEDILKLKNMMIQQIVDLILSEQEYDSDFVPFGSMIYKTENDEPHMVSDFYFLGHPRQAMITNLKTGKVECSLYVENDEKGINLSTINYIDNLYYKTKGE